MKNVNELLCTEEQVKAMNQKQLDDCLSEIDLYFSNLAESPEYDNYIANVKTHPPRRTKNLRLLMQADIES